MAYSLRKRTKVNLVDSTKTTNKGKGKGKVVDIDVANPEESKREGSNNTNNNKGKRKMEDIDKRENGDSDNTKNIEQQQQQQAVDLLSGDVIIHQLLPATNLFFQLDFQTILSLTLTSKALFIPLSSLISQHFNFKFHHTRTPLIHYHPRKLRIDTFDIGGLFDNPCLSNVTEIAFKNDPRLTEFTNYPFDKAITSLLSLNLTHFRIGWCFNQPINSLSHLTKLTHLEFSRSGFNHTIDNVLPLNLTNLTLPVSFNQPINLLYLTKLAHLEFNSYSYFNQPIDNLLPPNLTHLLLGSSFSHPIDHLPLDLVFLTLGTNFDRAINLLYLAKLTHLEFSTFSFNYPIDNLLPPNLSHLSLGWSYNHRIDHLPPDLTHLTLSKNFNLSIDLVYLTKLTHLEFSYSESEFNHPIDNRLPPNLTHLDLKNLHNFNHSIDHLPPDLIYLHLGLAFNQPINLLYLTKLAHLEFHSHGLFNHPIDNMLPHSLIILKFGDHFEFPIKYVLPPNITHLNIPKGTRSQYSHRKRMPSLLFFNDEPVKRSKLGRRLISDRL